MGLVGHGYQPMTHRTAALTDSPQDRVTKTARSRGRSLPGNCGRLTDTE